MKVRKAGLSLAKRIEKQKYFCFLYVRLVLEKPF
jgi:hypothetical protein